MGHPRLTEDFKIDAIRQITERAIPFVMFRSDWASAHIHLMRGKEVFRVPRLVAQRTTSRRRSGASFKTVDFKY